jgi:Lhr-like helicase
MTFSFGSAARRACRKGRQVLISSPTGLFSGGTQRTALVIIARLSFSPSPGSAA